MQLSDFTDLAEMVRCDDGRKSDEACKLRSLKVRVESDGERNRFDLTLPDAKPVRMSEWAGGQLFQKRLGIPYEFLARRCSPGLAQDIVDRFLGSARNGALLIRKIEREDGPRVRAVLPGSKARFENSDMLEIASQMAQEYDLAVQHFRIDDRSFHCRLLSSEGLDAGGKGRPEPHHFGVHLRNSEVGCGVPEAHLTVVRKVCSNGMIGFADQPLFRLPASSLHSIRKDRLIERFRDGLRKGFEGSDRVLSVIRKAQDHVVKMESLDEELERLHRAYGLSVRNLEIVREAFRRESRDSGGKETTVFTLANALTRAAQHLPGDDRVKYEHAAWKYLRSASRN